MEVSNDARHPVEPSAVASAPAPAPAQPAPSTRGPIIEESEMSQADYEKLLDQYDKLKSLAEGEVVRGRILKILENEVIVDIGYKSEGVIPIEEFRDPSGQMRAEVGQEIEVLLEKAEDTDGYVVLSKEKAEKMKIWDEVERAYNEGRVVTGRVIERIKGGLAVDIGIRSFLPGSLVDVRPVRNLDALRGKEFRMKVIKVNKRRGNIVLSRKAVLEEENAARKKTTLEGLDEGKVVKGTVKNITEYGAFIDLGGIDGLLHITDMSCGRVNHPEELFKVGDEVTVKVLKYNPETERVSLGLKQTQEDPWNHAEEAYPPGKKVRGKVMSITDYGAFVELEPGVEGLIYVSEMSWTKNVKHPSKLLEVGQELECQVLEVDSKAKRISLGLKQLEPDPWTLFTEKYSPGDKIAGKVRSITDYGVFIGIEEGVDGMVHKSDLSWTAKVNNPADLHHKGDDVEAIILSINHDEKKVSLGVKQLFDDPWPTIFNEYPPGKQCECKVLNIVDYGVFVRLRDGVEGLIPQNEVVEAKDENGEPKPVKIGDTVVAEIANVDSQDRRLTLSMRLGEGVNIQAAAQPAKRASAAPKKGSEAQASTLGELIKQKLG